MEIGNKILYIDLTEHSIREEEISKELYRKYLGSRGISAYLLFKHVKPGVDAFSPDNLLIFGAGTLTGTMAPCAGRVTITTKSPATGRYAKSSGGGAWGAELKQAGYQLVAISGESQSPVYIKIDGNKVEIKVQNIYGEKIYGRPMIYYTRN